MKIFAITNNKGGVGKTTTALNMAGGLRAVGCNVLLVDMDGQCNLTDSVLTKPDTTGGNTFDLLTDKTARPKPVRIRTADNRAGVLDLLPASKNLATFEPGSVDFDVLFSFPKAVQDYAKKYDVVIIDTPPAFGVCNLASLYAADVAIIPMIPDILPFRGFVAVRDTLAVVERTRRRPLPYRVLFNQVQARKNLHAVVMAQVRPDERFSATIRQNVALAESPSMYCDVFEYRPTSPGAADYARFINETIQTYDIKIHK